MLLRDPVLFAYGLLRVATTGDGDRWSYIDVYRDRDYPGSVQVRARRRSNLASGER